jgi:hypothetical protein
MRRFIVDFGGEEEADIYDYTPPVSQLPRYLIPFSDDTESPTRIARNYLYEDRAEQYEMWLVRYRIDYGGGTSQYMRGESIRCALGTNKKSLAYGWYYEDTTRDFPFGSKPGEGAGVKNKIEEIYYIKPAPWW